MSPFEEALTAAHAEVDAANRCIIALYSTVSDDVRRAEELREHLIEAKLAASRLLALLQKKENDERQRVADATRLTLGSDL